MGILQNSNAISSASGGASFYDYQIEQSARFDASASSNLSRTFGTPTSQRTYTFSAWIKKVAETGASTYPQIICKNNGFDGSGASFLFVSDSLAVYGFGTSGGNRTDSVGKFRDISGFNHIVFRYDTTQSTATDRFKLYLNGDRLTVSGGTNPSQNSDLSRFNTADTHRLGGGTYHFDGYMAEVIFTDGQSYEPTQFGESKNGVWIPKDPSGTTFGNNGFHLKFENASDLGNDSSGNNNDFTANNMGADHKTKDTMTFGS